jgi:hypothetical protein
LALKKKNASFKALITGVYFQDSVIGLRNQKIPFRQNQLTFEIAYPLFGNEEKIEFSYWLQGQDKGWGAFTKDSKKEYTNLREGSYTLHVRAKDASGLLSQETTMSFTILPPWYRSWLAYLSYIVMFGYGIYLFGKYQSQRSRVKAENERRSDELRAARDFQQSMLPKNIPMRSDLDISAFLRSSTEIGGDYYDFFEEENGDLYVVCGDATGHGIISGMMVSIAKAGLNGISVDFPNKILGQLNRVVKKVDLGTMRMSLNILQVSSQKVMMSSAAMPPIYHFVAATGQVEEIQMVGLPLGGLRKEEFELQEREFATGDVFVLLSDGLPEAPNKQGDMFNYDRILQLLSVHGHKTSDQIKTEFIKAVDEWLDGENNPDDITVLVIKKK